MKVPIPEDWDGQSWTCVKVFWPNSLSWLAILRGLVLSPSRGRFWEETSGTITLAQAVGLLIDAKTLPFALCGADGVVPCDGDIPPALIFGDESFCDCEVEDMACTDCPPIKIEDGKLWWFNCGEWQEVGEIGGTASPEVVDPWPNDAQGNPPTLYACGKAKAVHDAILAVADGFWDTRSSLPWKWVGDVEGTVPGYNLSNTWIVDGVVNILLLDALYDVGDIFDTWLQGQVLCRLVGLFGADQEGITSDQFVAIKQAYIGEFGPVLSAPYVNAANALGKGNLSSIAKLGAGDAAANCDCPEAPTGETAPDVNGWYWSAPLTNRDIFVTTDGSIRYVAIQWQTVKEVFALRYDLQLDSAINIKSMALPSGTGLTNISADTSENIAGDQNNGHYVNNFVHSSSSFMDVILGAGQGILRSGSGCALTSITPATPSAAGLTNVACGYGIMRAFNGPGWAHFSNIRLLHNTNSANGGQ